MNYFFSIHGRMTRRIYFLFVAFCLSFTALPIILMLNLPTSVTRAIGSGFTWIILIVSLLTHTVLFFATVKRLHDLDVTGKAAFFIFIAPISYLMVIWLLASSYSDLGGVNQYGPNPRKSIEIREAIPPYPPATW